MLMHPCYPASFLKYLRFLDTAQPQQPLHLVSTMNDGWIGRDPLLSPVLPLPHPFVLTMPTWFLQFPTPTSPNEG